MTVTVNGKPMELPEGLSVDGLLSRLKVRREFTAVALNREVTPSAPATPTPCSPTETRSRSSARWAAAKGRSAMYDTSLWLGGKEFKSRLIVGTGKYPSFENMREAIEASGAEIVTVAVRRVSLPGQGESLLDFIDPKKYTLLPNTAGCYTADEAVRTCYLAREAGLGDPGQARGHRRLAHAVPRRARACSRPPARWPGRASRSCRTPTTTRSWPRSSRTPAPPRSCRWARPIGSGLGIRNPYNIKLILEAVTRPRASSTRASAPRRTRPSPWSSAATAC